ncbi:MAG: Gfo/Idh/MocA family oxidoreductase [Gemmatimonadetes bacterium]|jgi:predicted dehydrogenase|nr:Gfo/Idh/MocA family oxidoreductase [Gemmatimonadota bacterium]
MAKKKIRIGLIGCGGNMRHAHLPRMKEDGAVELVAVTDPVKSQAELLIEAWGSEVAYYEDFKKMIRQEELDAISISSPHSVHYQQVRAALNAGLHVICEKPLTTASRDSKALLRLAEKKNLFLVVAYQRNFYPPHVYARELVQKGAIGEVNAVVSYVTQGWGGRGWRGDPELAGGGMFMDTGSHLVASTLWISGLQPAEVAAFMDKRGKKVDIDAVVNVRFANGALGTLNTIGSASRHDERLAIHGSKGCIVFHLHQWGIKSVLLNDEPVEIPARIKEDSPDAAFFRYIRNGGKGYEIADFALQVARVSEAAYRSLEQKKPVRVAR